MADSKPDLRAFALRADAGEITGATTSYRDGNTYDIKAALDDGGGTIVIDANEEPDLAEILASSQILKSVSVPEKTSKSAAPAQKG